jgi:Tol biopolymer transport system component
MSIAIRREAMPRAAILIAVVLLLIALIATAVALTGSPTRPPAPLVVTNGMIAFTSGSNIEAVQPDGTGRRVLVSSGTEVNNMSFSPDGRRFAYFVKNGANWDLIVADADGSHSIRVASGAYLDTSIPEWSPDGTRIAYSASTSPTGAAPSCAGFGTQNGDFCYSRIFVAQADGSGAHQIGDPTLDARGVSWSPDGSTIAFGGGNATPGINVRLYVMNSDGTNVRTLGSVRGTDWAFVQTDWSHDGSKIVGQASAADDINEWDIWVIDAKTGEGTNVGAKVGVDEIIPSWAPDRDALVWMADGIILREAGAAPIDLQVPSAGIPFWSPDGRLLSSVSDAGDLVVNDLRGDVKFRIAGASDKPAWQGLVSGG